MCTRTDEKGLLQRQRRPEVPPASTWLTDNVTGTLPNENAQQRYLQAKVTPAASCWVSMQAIQQERKNPKRWEKEHDSKLRQIRLLHVVNRCRIVSRSDFLKYSHPKCSHCNASFALLLESTHHAWSCGFGIPSAVQMRTRGTQPMRSTTQHAKPAAVSTPVL